MTKEQKRTIIKELELIAGKYNKSVTFRDRDMRKKKVFIWKLTKRGKRAFDWTRLLVLADKARDLDCDVYFCGYKDSYWSKRLIIIPCTEKYANAVVVHLPG